MKKLFFATLFCLFLCGSLFAQSQQVSLSGGQMTIGQLFREVESQTGLSVDFDAREVSTSKSVSVPAGTSSVKAVLDAALGSSYTWTINGKHVVVSAPKAKSGVVSGVVKDTNGEPVAGVGVLVKGTATGTVTGADGSYSINASSKATLLFSTIGYKDAEEAIAGRSTINVTIEEDALFLDETVVVGYGATKKENLTGAVSVVGAEEISKRSQANLGNLLQGTVPGMTVTTASGKPGESASINIRGWNSINSGSPLVLIDGVAGSLDRVNPNDVESISVLKDASSAAVYGAQAAFGVILVTTKSGANEEGRAKVRYSGRFGFSLPTTRTDYESRGYYSVYIPNKFQKSSQGTNAINYTEDDMAELWARRNDVVENPERPWVIVDENGMYRYYGNTDWWHYYFNDLKPMMNHDLSFTGGTKTIKYFLSANYNREQGVFKQNPDIYNKYNLRARISFDVTKWLNISNNAAYYASDYNYPGYSDVKRTLYHVSAGYYAFLTPENPDGNLLYETQMGGGGDGTNAILADKNYTNMTRTSNFTNTAEITIKPIKQLEIKGNYTYSYNSHQNRTRAVNEVVGGKYPGKTIVLTAPDDKGQDEGFEDKLIEGTQSVDLHSVNVYATYTDKFADAHNLKIMLGGNYETYYHKKLSATGYSLYSQELNDQNLVSADETGMKRTTTGGGQSDYALMGFFGRINYDYKGKYLLEISGRYDGSSRFPRSQRWGFFPSFSVGWRFAGENFFKPIKSWWNDGKIRFSYGNLGNQQVGYYDYIRTVSLSTQSYLFGGDKSAVANISAPVASNLTWETVEQMNLGLDLAFLENRITFTGEAYIRNTKNMLTTGKALPSVYGASAPKTNNADLRTQGYELSLTYRDRFMLLGQPFEYSIGGTFNDFVGFITKFDNPTKNLSSTYYEGMRYGEIWGYTTGGLFKTDEEARSYPVDQSPVCSIIYASPGEEQGLRAGDLKYLDRDGDGIIGTGANTVDNPGDRVIIGNSQPRYQYGATLTLNWYGVDFSLFLQGVGRQDWYPGTDDRIFWGPYARPFSNWIQKDFLDRCWSPENPNAYFPRQRGYVAGVGAGRELTTTNDHYLQNIGYLRVKNVTVGYTFPKKWTQKISIESIRLYFSGENLAYYSPGFHSEYIDPELASKTVKGLVAYPWQKTFMFGIDINF
ncbi:MAG: TonB-dependent receptor [Bacteroidales bacterium]|nr:TonB-dependent receptor [Bacteroidales bacterium]